jgi:hypothetical protein
VGFRRFLFLNTVGNVTSQSRVDQYVMTLVVLFLGVRFIVVAPLAAG